MFVKRDSAGPCCVQEKMLLQLHPLYAGHEVGQSGGANFQKSSLPPCPVALRTAWGERRTQQPETAPFSEELPGLRKVKVVEMVPPERKGSLLCPGHQAQLSGPQ